jgi:CBS domain-containing membrane protein
MTKKVFTLQIDKKVFAAQQIMNWAHVRHIPVVDRDGRLVGIVTHRDLLAASISKIPSRIANSEQNQHVWSISIDTIMKTNVQIISPEATVQEAAKVMREKKIGCLPVVSQGKLVGIITEHDLLKIIEGLKN